MPRKVRRAYEREARHIILHVTQEGDHTPDDSGYCSQCVKLIIAALIGAERRGVRRAQRKAAMLACPPRPIKEFWETLTPEQQEAILTLPSGPPHLTPPRGRD